MKKKRSGTKKRIKKREKKENGKKERAKKGRGAKCKNKCTTGRLAEKEAEKGDVWRKRRNEKRNEKRNTPGESYRKESKIKNEETTTGKEKAEGKDSVETDRALRQSRRRFR